MASYGKIALSLGILALVGALFIPTLVDSSQEDQNTTVALQEGGNYSLTDRLVVRVVKSNGTTGEATISYLNSRTSHATSVTLSEGQSQNITLDGEYIETRLDDVTTDGETTTTTEYPPTFGWEEGAITFTDSLPIILVLLAFVALVGVLKAIA